MDNIRRFSSFIKLVIGVALSIISIIMFSDFARSERSVLMMGSRFQAGGARVQAIVAELFLGFLFVTGIVLIFISIRDLVSIYKK
jgi:glycerol uptake facilitator-like aquaporin